MSCEENLKLSDLPSPKEVLVMLSNALKELSEPGLSIPEIRRQRGVINAAQVYHGLFRAYLKYQELMNQANRK
jgi:hypothetical protein